MKILVLTKRQYMSKDLLRDRYGRFFAIPEALAALGNSVHGVCLDYYNSAPVPGDFRAAVTWDSFCARNPKQIYRYFCFLQHQLRRWRPDAIWAASDSFHVVLGTVLQGMHRIPCVADIYDQFDAYGANRMPGVGVAYRLAVSRATGVTCASRRLAAWANLLRARQARPAIPLENAIEGDLFRSLSTSESRARFGMNQESAWIGTAGALTADRGIATLYRAWELLSSRSPKWALAVAGPRDIPPPASARDFGIMAQAEVPYLLNALDVGIVCNDDNMFARYCFPQKLYEMLACGIPVVAAEVGEFADRKDWPGRVFTYRAGNAEELSGQIERALAVPKNFAPPRPPTWEDQATELFNYLQRVTGEASG